MNKRLAATIVGALGVLLLTPPSFGHHSFTAEFDDRNPVELNGVISKIDWINPHVYIYLDVKDKDGKVTTWALECHPTHWFSKAGLKKSMLGEGQAVTVSAFRAKDGSKALAYTRKITYADGHFYQLFTDDAVLH